MVVKKAVVILDDKTAFQAIYVDGQLMNYDETLYACDIIAAVGGSDIPFTLEQRVYDACVDVVWPKTLAEVENQFEAV